MSECKEVQNAIYEERLSGNQVPESSSSSKMKMREDNGLQNLCVVHEVSVDDGALGVVSPGAIMPQLPGEEGANVRNRSNSPPRQCKKKGLSELGESFSCPRQSVRISARLSQIGTSSHHRDGTSSASISNGDINNCNLRFYERGNLVEPSKLWEIGMQVGITCRGDKEEVVKEYFCMEERDSKVVKCSKEGDKNGLLC